MRKITPIVAFSRLVLFVASIQPLKRLMRKITPIVAFSRLASSILEKADMNELL